MFICVMTFHDYKSNIHKITHCAFIHRLCLMDSFLMLNHTGLLLEQFPTKITKLLKIMNLFHMLLIFRLGTETFSTLTNIAFGHSKDNLTHVQVWITNVNPALQTFILLFGINFADNGLIRDISIEGFPEFVGHFVSVHGGNMSFQETEV